MVLVEVCVETLEQARAAQAGGADRIELCASLDQQGTTPPDSLLAATIAALAIPVFVMIRPRPGSFVYSPDELATMREAVNRARALGAGGIATGALTAAGQVDAGAVRALVDEAAPLPVTFHRAFDAVAEPRASLEMLVACGVARILTSGGADTALEGRHAIARLVQQAGGRIVVMAAGSVRGANVQQLLLASGVTEVHARLATEDATRELLAAVRASRTQAR